MKTLSSHRKKQQGAVLVVSLSMLLILTIIGVTALRTSTLEERMASNWALKMRSFWAAESALNVASMDIDLLGDATISDDESLTVDLTEVTAGGNNDGDGNQAGESVRGQAQVEYLGAGIAFGYSAGIDTVSAAMHRFELVADGEISRSGNTLSRSQVAGGVEVLGPGN